MVGLVFLFTINYNYSRDRLHYTKENTPVQKRENLMEFFDALIHNTILLSAVAGWFVAQVLKTLIHLIFTRKFVAERLVGSGGMPSSHSSTVCALVTAVAIQKGAGSIEFAITLILAIIVMYDAMGVRRETGIQARVLNEMIQLFEDMGSDMSAQDKLKEFVGHTPLQVVMGAILGVLIALAMNL